MALGPKVSETKNDYTAKGQKKFTHQPNEPVSRLSVTRKMWSWGPETKNNCAGEVQQQFIPLTK
jgi:hypothetical protein